MVEILNAVQRVQKARGYNKIAAVMTIIPVNLARIRDRHHQFIDLVADRQSRTAGLVVPTKPAGWPL